MSTKIVGILNITPDSFSDGNLNYTIDQAISHVCKMIEDKVDIIDIGAESTKPNADKLSAEQEWQRLEPVLATIINMAKSSDIKISLDSYHV